MISIPIFFLPSIHHGTLLHSASLKLLSNELTQTKPNQTSTVLVVIVALHIYILIIIVIFSFAYTTTANI